VGMLQVELGDDDDERWEKEAELYLFPTAHALDKRTHASTTRGTPRS